LSYRDVDDLLAERGLMVSNESIRRWVLKFRPIIAKNLRACREDACGDWPELRGWTILVVSQSKFQQWVESRYSLLLLWPPIRRFSPPPPGGERWNGGNLRQLSRNIASRESNKNPAEGLDLSLSEMKYLASILVFGDDRTRTLPIELVGQTRAAAVC
jgi:hypothetical protein